VWREQDNCLKLLAKDYEQRACVAGGFVMDSDALGIVIGDNEANLELLRFHPRYVMQVHKHDRSFSLTIAITELLKAEMDSSS
jgi:hypothetical protein